ncbi:MAG: error-prone DNA polymerase [Chthoniobacteraceae bacterium]|jgi:error-prone DNA polymerase
MKLRYIELHARSAFSFLRAASQPETLVEQAASLELPALAVCDRDGVYGAARVHAAAREKKLRPIVGAELTLEDGSVLPVLVESRDGYRNLCRLITRAKLRGTKEYAPVHWNDLPEFSKGLVALSGDEEGPVRRAIERGDKDHAQQVVRRLADCFGQKNVFVEIQRQLRRGEKTVNRTIVQLAEAEGLPLLATNGVLYATREERPLLDVFTCTRNHTNLDAGGRLLAANEERYLKTPEQMRRLFEDLPEAITNTLRLGERLEFSLENLGYEFPRYPVPEGETMDSFLRKMTMAGARARYSHLSGRVAAQIERELTLIAKLGFSGYFLIVWDLVNFCTENRILVQGRGSAANSVVCYSLGITACDPIACNLLFERFLSEGRTSWPDIDLDLPSGDRRESVIQEVYRRYGPSGAAMTANVITYRGKSAMREIGKALGFEPETLNRFSHLFANGDFPHTMELAEQLKRSGVENAHPRAPAAIELYRRIYGMPRHLGQHSGGMIICQGQLDSIVPLERASMEGRVVAQWDKDDCEDLGIIKVDLLGLGMISVMQDSLELCASRGRPIDLAAIPKDDAATYDLMCAADTIGVFQIESRAQMATLPRMLPRCFYDVVVEVAIIRPGPILGDMLHPFLARRAGKEEVRYFDERLKPVLERTLGVPLFQEQLLKIAMVMGDFSGGEAEELRRALSFHRSPERMEKVCVKLRAGMERNGTKPEVIEAVTKAVQSFAVYGFPESHAISFAILAYASCWLKVHRAAEFFAGLLNNQPMGFYSPATLVADAKRHGLRIKPGSVLESDWFCAVEGDEVLRLGLCYVRGLRREDGERIVAERQKAPFASLVDFQLRTALPQTAARALAKIGALNGLAEHRRDAQWKVEVSRDADDLFARVENEAALPLVQMNPVERLRADYSGTGLSIGPHPMKLIRSQLPEIRRASDLPAERNGTMVKIAGQVICRQRPGTAKGFVFISLEDETGVSNAIVTPQLFERYRLLITEEPFLIITGVMQNVDNVIHVKARHIEALQFRELMLPASHDFR